MSHTASIVFGLSCASSFILTATNVATVLQCIGPSMLPTLYPSDMVVLDIISYKILKRQYRLGDVVCAIAPHDPTILISKRILGMPGDVICKDPLALNREYIRIPDGHVWLQGDNVHESIDSRTYGPVPLGLLKGRVVMSFWPNINWIGNGVDEAKKMISELNKANS